MTNLTIPRNIVNYILFKNKRETRDRLHILLYYIQAWYLAIYNKPLFINIFEAGIFGPFFAGIYELQKSRHITIEYDNQEIDLPKEIIDHVDEVLEVYNKYSPSQLIDMVRSESPWIKARGNCDPALPCKILIKEEDMKNYYQLRMKDVI